MHHPTFSIDSLCRLFGKQDYYRADGARSVAFPIWGAAWHNSCHAFPTFSRRGADGRQIDLSGLIELVEKLGIAFGVMPVGPARRACEILNAVS